jgi:predicted phosphodiesterase
LSKQTRRKRSSSERILWILSLFLVGSMVISLVIVALPSAPAPTPTAYPTITPIPHPTRTPAPIPSELPPTLTVAPSPAITATATATEVPIGPEMPTETPTLTPTLIAPTQPPIGPELPTATPTASSSMTSTPASAALVGPTLIFAVCGDSRGNPKVYGRILAAVQADGSQFLAHTGDLVDEGSEGNWLDFQKIMAGFALPFYPVPGNHDALGGALDNYLMYSGSPAAHYSFDMPPAHLTFADSHNGGINAAELAWLRDDLSATDQPVKLVFLHHPPFDPDGTDHIMAYGNESFMALMAEEGVDYVFAGHIHAYARAERDGVVYIYTGGGGAPLYSGDHPQAFYHYLRVKVTGDQVEVDVVKI